jgi:uncharacterized protein (TIGR00645 family)
MQELWHLISDVGHLSENDVMLLVLGLVDVVMIANLLIMVIIGGYETFVSRIQIRDHPDQPEWLSHVNANVLKVKLAMAIVGISSIHLLKTFIDANKIDSETMLWQTLIHLAIVVSAIALAAIDRFLSPKSTAQMAAEAHEHERLAAAAGVDAPPGPASTDGHHEPPTAPGKPAPATG